jgi:hypothetical protein
MNTPLAQNRTPIDLMTNSSVKCNIRGASSDGKRQFSLHNIADDGAPSGRETSEHFM